MAIIKCPNQEYTGVSASVTFVDGVGETTDEYLINWFKEHGYTVLNDGDTVEELSNVEVEEPARKSRKSTKNE